MTWKMNDLEDDFRLAPRELLNSIHADSTTPFADMKETT